MKLTYLTLLLATGFLANAAQADSLSITHDQAFSNPSVFNLADTSIEFVHQAGSVTARSWLTQQTRFGQRDITLGDEAWIKKGSWTWNASLQTSPTHAITPHWSAACGIQRVLSGTGVVLTAQAGAASYTGVVGQSKPISLALGLDYYYGDNLVGGSVQQTRINGNSASVLLLHSSFKLDDQNSLNAYAAVGHGLEPVGPGLRAIVRIRSVMLNWSHQLNKSISFQLGLGREAETPGYTATLSSIGLRYLF